MAERKQSATTEKTQVDKTVDEGEKSTIRPAPWPMTTVGIFVAIIIAAFVVMCWWAILFALQVAKPVVSSENDRTGRWALGNERRESGWNERRSARGAVAVSGVVTAIDGSTVTVSGRGEQVTVRQNDDTVVGGDANELAVNDTVIVFGDTEADGSVTAQRILVRNKGMSERMERSGDMIHRPDA